MQEAAHEREYLLSDLVINIGASAIVTRKGSRDEDAFVTTLNQDGGREERNEPVRRKEAEKSIAYKSDHYQQSHDTGQRKTMHM